MLLAEDLVELDVFQSLSWLIPAVGLGAGALFALWAFFDRLMQSLSQTRPLPRPVTICVPSARPEIVLPPPPPPTRMFTPSPPAKPGSSPTQMRPRGRSGLRSRKERREALRRGGNPVAVHISDADALATPYEASALDRSKGGLCLSVPQEVAVGTVLSVKSTLYPDCAMWVQVRVRSCRPRDDRWLLGCQFLQVQPWNILLHFG